jgi:hypothetical protein
MEGRLIPSSKISEFNDFMQVIRDSNNWLHRLGLSSIRPPKKPPDKAIPIPTPVTPPTSHPTPSRTSTVITTLPKRLEHPTTNIGTAECIIGEYIGKRKDREVQKEEEETHRQATPRPPKRINAYVKPKKPQPKDASSIAPTPLKVSEPTSNEQIATTNNPTATSNSHSNKEIDPAIAKPQVAISIPPVAKSFWPPNLIIIIMSVVAMISPKPTPPPIHVWNVIRSSPQELLHFEDKV